MITRVRGIPSRPLRVTAILDAYNDADIVGAVIEHLMAQGIAVFVVDHGSTDQTREQAGLYLDRGLVGVAENAAAELPQLEADWLLRLSANQLVESPWPSVGLLEGIAIVDKLGYTAIDFETFDFGPGEAGGRSTGLEYYRLSATPAPPRSQCWKQLELPAEHVFPLPFLIKQYSAEPFDPAHLVRFDPIKAAIHLSLRNRSVDELEQRHRESVLRRNEEIGRERAHWQERLSALEREVALLHRDNASLVQENDALVHRQRNLEEEIEIARVRLSQLTEDMQAKMRDAVAAEQLLSELEQQNQRLESELQRTRAVAESTLDLEARIASQHAALQEAQSELQRASQNAAQRLAEAAQRLSESEERKRSLEIELDQRGFDLREKQTASDEAHAELRKAQTALERLPELERTCHLLRDEIDQSQPLLRRFWVVEHRNEWLESEVKQARAVLKRLAEAEHQNQAMSAELTVARPSAKRLAEVEEALRAARSELESARRALGRITELESQLRDVFMSHSWRVTYPIRRSASLLMATLARYRR
jgi:hypothetical protein